MDIWTNCRYDWRAPWANWFSSEFPVGRTCSCLECHPVVERSTRSSQPPSAADWLQRLMTPQPIQRSHLQQNDAEKCHHLCRRRLLVGRWREERRVYPLALPRHSSTSQVMMHGVDTMPQYFQIEPHFHLSCNQGRTGQFPTTTLPAQPNFHSTSPTLQNLKNRLFSTQNHPFYHFNPAGGHCPNASMVSPPLVVMYCKCKIFTDFQ